MTEGVKGKTTPCCSEARFSCAGQG